MENLREALVESALRHVRNTRSINFNDIVISIKSSDVVTDDRKL